MLSVCLAFQTKVFTLLENQNQELLEIKAFLQNNSAGSDGNSKPDYSRIPRLPLGDCDALRSVETWIEVKANYDLLVSTFHV